MSGAIATTSLMVLSKLPLRYRQVRHDFIREGCVAQSPVNGLLSTLWRKTELDLCCAVQRACSPRFLSEPQMSQSILIDHRYSICMTEDL